MGVNVNPQGVFQRLQGGDLGQRVDQADRVRVNRRPRRVDILDQPDEPEIVVKNDVTVVGDPLIHPDAAPDVLLGA